jgi:ammonia channel protein AmtB
MLWFSALLDLYVWIAVCDLSSVKMTSPHACIPSVWAAEISRPACAKSETLRQQTCQVWGVHRYAGSTGVIVVLISAWGKVRSCMKNWKIRWKQKESGQQWLGCNLRTGWDREHNLLRPAGVNSSWDPHLQNDRHKMGLEVWLKW